MIRLRSDQVSRRIGKISATLFGYPVKRIKRTRELLFIVFYVERNWGRIEGEIEILIIIIKL